MAISPTTAPVFMSFSVRACSSALPANSKLSPWRAAISARPSRLSASSTLSLVVTALSISAVMATWRAPSSRLMVAKPCLWVATTTSLTGTSAPIGERR